MKINEAIRKIMKTKGITQMQMKNSLGYKSQSNVAGRLKSDMQMSNVVEFLNVLNYEIVIQPKSTRGKRANGAYVINNREESEWFMDMRELALEDKLEMVIV